MIALAVRRATAGALLGALTLAGCGNDEQPAASSTAPAPITSVIAPAVVAPPPQAAPPPPEVLTDVLYRLSDPSIPADQKVPLIEGAVAGNAEQIDKFAHALVDNQYAPLGFTAENIAWSASNPNHVAADVTVHSENPALGGGFTFPMEFIQAGNAWQLSRTTADILLTLGQNPPPP